MPRGVRTLDELDQLITDYMEFDEFVVDVETMGDHRGIPLRNEVFWISLAGPGRADVIPCGHPLGERVIRDPGDPFYRVHNGKHQEHRINESSGRPKWVTVPDPFTPAPKQLWISDVIEALRPLFFSSRRIIGQNVKFDILSLAKYFGAIPPGPYGDTLMAAKLIDENQFAYDLGKLVRRAFKFEYDKIGKKVEVHPFSEAAYYSYLDAKYTWLLWRLYQKQLDAQQVGHIFDMEMEVLTVILDMENTGVAIDEGVLEDLGLEFSLEMAKLQIEIDAVWNKDTSINLNAPLQVGELVYDILDRPCKEFTETGQRAVSKEALERFPNSKTVQQILEWKKLAKLQGTFIEGLQERLHEGRVHASFNQAGTGDRGQGKGGTVSGRLSCSSPNIQQIPVRSERGKRVRDVFVAGPGNVLIVSDLSQIELRVLAHFTQDRTLMRAYKNGDDLHSILAARVFGDDFTPAQRGLAKNGNFSVLFGAQAATLVRRYGFPNVKLAQQVLDGFYTAYPRVGPWKERVVEEAVARYSKKTKTPPYVETILGRRRRLPALQYANRGERSAAERQAISVTISGSAADLFKVVMINCQELLTARPWEGHILMTVHDELVVEVPEEFAEEGLRLVKAAMENVDDPFTGEPILTVPIVADAKIVKRWSEAK
jgi:DNA polymerase I-like protein with 3'-5' exonuclease and polymerase domains